MNNDDPDPAGRRRRSLWALVVVVVLVAGGWVLQQRLRANANMEDCLLSGRRNCVPIGQ
jgi:hypothetical protein